MRDQKREAAIGLPLFSFHSGQRVEKAEIGQKKADMLLFVLLFRCRHFSYIFTVKTLSRIAAQRMYCRHQGRHHFSQLQGMIYELSPDGMQSIPKVKGV